MGRSFDGIVDPLTQITAPPVDETPEQRRAREREEANAKKISEQIDEALKAEREEGKAKRKNRLKVLLLGQSESGTFKFPRSLSYHAVPPFFFPSGRLGFLSSEFQISLRIFPVSPRARFLIFRCTGDIHCT